jgi:hypothetical protein
MAEGFEEAVLDHNAPRRAMGRAWSSTRVLDRPDCVARVVGIIQRCSSRGGLAGTGAVPVDKAPHGESSQGQPVEYVTAFRER